jgi:voltage-gated potassium channel
MAIRQRSDPRVLSLVLSADRNMCPRVSSITEEGPVRGYTFQLREFLYRNLEPAAQAEGGLSHFNRVIVWLIIFASVVAILETEDTLRGAMPGVFWIAEFFIVMVFSIEYLARVYAAGEQPRYSGVRGRLRYMLSWWAIVDLLAILPFILTGGTYNSFIIRLLKLLRLLRVARVGRFSQAWVSLSDAIYGRRFELALSGTVAFLIMLISSAFLYVFEADTQPEAFGSIPRAFWWSVATLTTVGYGDVTPVTVLGRIFAGFTAVAGIGLIAMPTGILAAAFSEAMRKRNELAKNENDVKEDS